MRRRATLAAFLALTGCALSERPHVDKRIWPLVVRRPTAAPPARHGRVLLVRSVRAAPGLEARGVQSLLPDGSMQADFYEEWAVPPAEAVESDLRQWLAESGLFQAVLAPGSRLSPDLIAEPELLAFWADLPAARARCALSIVLLDQRQGATAGVLMQRTFAASVPLSATDVPAIVESLRAALADVLRQIEAALADV
jgi:cholesterol transport system auxiliary component